MFSRNKPFHSITRYLDTTQGTSSGFTLIEALVTVLMVGVLGAIAAPNILAVGNNPLRDSTNHLAGQLRLVRSKAISQTSAYRIRWNMIPNSTAPNVQTQLIIERAATCNSPTWTRDAAFTEEDVTTKKNIELSALRVNGAFPNSVLDPTPSTPGLNWMVCINSRGMADKNISWTFRLRQSSAGPTQRLEIFPGGAIQVYDN